MKLYLVRNGKPGWTCWRPEAAPGGLPVPLHDYLRAFAARADAARYARAVNDALLREGLTGRATVQGPWGGEERLAVNPRFAEQLSWGAFSGELKEATRWPHGVLSDWMADLGLPAPALKAPPPKRPYDFVPPPLNIWWEDVRHTLTAEQKGRVLLPFDRLSFVAVEETELVG